MGRMFVESMQELDVSLEDMVSMHFSSNCYPPIPQFMVGVACEAIRAAASDDWYYEIPLPEGVEHRSGKTVVTASEIIENCRLEGFVDYEYEARMFDEPDED